MEERVQELEKRVPALERQLAEQPDADFITALGRLTWELKKEPLSPERVMALVQAVEILVRINSHMG